MKSTLSRFIFCFAAGLALALPGAAVKYCGLCNAGDPPGLQCICRLPEGGWYSSTCAVGCLDPDLAWAAPPAGDLFLAGAVGEDAAALAGAPAPVGGEARTCSSR